MAQIMEEKLLKGIASSMEATVRIGKNGITDHMLDEIKKQLKKRKIVKIKLLKSFVSGNDKKKAIEDVISKTGSKLIRKIGGAFVIYKGN